MYNWIIWQRVAVLFESNLLVLRNFNNLIINWCDQMSDNGYTE